MHALICSISQTHLPSPPHTNSSISRASRFSMRTTLVRHSSLTTRPVLTYLGSSGDYISDNLFIGGSEIKTLEMGLAENTTVNIGIMGVGYDTNEAAQTVYPSIIDQMVDQKLINIKAYSLWLNDLYSSTGSILFGGVDSDKYTGSLTSVPVLKDADSGAITSFTVALTSISATGSAGNTTHLTNSTFAEAVILDSGTTLTYLPDDLVATILGLVGAVDDSQNSGNVYIDCNAKGTTFSYGFGGSDDPVIKVDISELLFSLSGFYSGDLPFASTCTFGIVPGGTGPFLLGDTFLRSAYVVYDL